MSYNDLYDAAQAALGEIANESVNMGIPPGAEPLPLKEQIAQFVADLPDLVAKGTRYKQIEQQYGIGAADAYTKDMMAKIFKPRRRRSPM